MDEKKKKYQSNTKAKKKYNDSLSTFQIDKELHQRVKNYCKNKNLKIRDFLTKIISENL